MTRKSFAIAAALILAVAPVANATDAVVRVPVDSQMSAEIALGPATRQKLTGTIAAPATIEADGNHVAHLSSHVPARVVRLIAQPGENVHKSQDLVILSSIELGQAKTEYLKSKSLADMALQHLKREEELYSKKIAAYRDVLDARAQYDTARAQYRAALEALRILIPQSDIDRLEWSSDSRPLADFALVSPINGTLVSRNLSIGELIDRNDDAFTVIDLDTVWVFANIYEHDLSALKLNARAQITTDSYPDREFAGSVSYVGSTVDAKTRTVQARIDVPNPSHILKPGMFAHVRIDTDMTAREALTVPTEAIFTAGKRTFVFIAIGKNEYAVRDVEVGLENDKMVEVLSGLSEGEQVVVRGGLALKALMAAPKAG